MYRVHTDSDVHQQIEALPPSALPNYAEACTFLELSPWNGDSVNAGNPDAPVRNMVFGTENDGLITYLIVEERREVHVLMVQWVGGS